jgi:hypothetical protein
LTTIACASARAPAFEGHGITSFPLSLPANTWIHFAAHRSSGNASIWVNGTEVAAGRFVDNASPTSSLKFGHRGSPDDTPGSTDTRGFVLNGRIDEVELFVGRALSDAEIAGIFSAGSAGKCKPVRHGQHPQTEGAHSAALTPGWDIFTDPLRKGKVVWNVPGIQRRLNVTFILGGPYQITNTRSGLISSTRGPQSTLVPVSTLAGTQT